MYISAVTIDNDFNSYAIMKIEDQLKQGNKVMVKLEKEPDNPWDKKAVRVVCGKRSIGYVAASSEYVRKGTIGRDVVYQQLERYEKLKATYSAYLVKIENIDMKGKQGWRLILRKRNKADSFIDCLEKAKAFASKYNNGNEVSVLTDILIRNLEEISDIINDQIKETDEQVV